MPQIPSTNMPPQVDPVDKRQAAREVIDILQEISDLLVRNKPSIPHLVCLEPGRGLTDLQNTNLDRTELSLCVSLIENGVNPDALAVRVFPNPTPAYGGAFKTRIWLTFSAIWRFTGCY